MAPSGPVSGLLGPLESDLPFLASLPAQSYTVESNQRPSGKYVHTGPVCRTGPTASNSENNPGAHPRTSAAFSLHPAVSSEGNGDSSEN